MKQKVFMDKPTQNVQLNPQVPDDKGSYMTICWSQKLIVGPQDGAGIRLTTVCSPTIPTVILLRKITQQLLVLSCDGCVEE